MSPDRVPRRSPQASRRRSITARSAHRPAMLPEEAGRRPCPGAHRVQAGDEAATARVVAAPVVVRVGRGRAARPDGGRDGHHGARADPDHRRAGVRGHGGGSDTAAQPALQPGASAARQADHRRRGDLHPAAHGPGLRRVPAGAGTARGVRVGQRSRAADALGAATDDRAHAAVRAGGVRVRPRPRRSGRRVGGAGTVRVVAQPDRARLTGHARRGHGRFPAGVAVAVVAGPTAAAALPGTVGNGARRRRGHEDERAGGGAGGGAAGRVVAVARRPAAPGRLARWRPAGHARRGRCRRRGGDRGRRRVDGLSRRRPATALEPAGTCAGRRGPARDSGHLAAVSRAVPRRHAHPVRPGGGGVQRLPVRRGVPRFALVLPAGGVAGEDASGRAGDVAGRGRHRGRPAPAAARRAVPAAAGGRSAGRGDGRRP
jgi:hypothetical protein